MTPQLEKQLADMAAALAALTTANGAPGTAAPAGFGAAPAAFGAPPPMGAGTGFLTPPAPQGAMPQPMGWSVVMEIEVQGPHGAGKATLDL